MKKVLLFMLFSIVLFDYLKAQEKGNLVLGISTDVTKTRFSDLSCSPNLSYYPINNLGFQVSGLYDDRGGIIYKETTLEIKYYPCKNGFIQSGYLYNSYNDNPNHGFTVSLGYTSHLNRLNIEPSVRFIGYKDINRLNLSIGISYRLN